MTTPDPDSQLAFINRIGEVQSSDTPPAAGKIYLDDNLAVLKGLPAGQVDLIYIDPPFNTGRQQTHTELSAQRSKEGERQGFGGRQYEMSEGMTRGYPDIFDNYLEWLEPRLRQAHRILSPTGTLYLHLDWREVHYAKVLMDKIFGRNHFVNEIIWAYDFGGRSKRRWPRKHDNILMYVKNPEDYTFNTDAVDRIPYMAPGLVSPEKQKRGKRPTDCWWHTIVPTNSTQRTGYPTQKPAGIIERIVAASSNPGDLVMDFFAGSGTTGAVCLELDRNFILVDNNPEALEVMSERFPEQADLEWVGYSPEGGPQENSAE